MTLAARYKKAKTKCTMICPQCARLCELHADHQEMHRDGIHEWTYARRGNLKIVITDVNAEEQKKGM